MPDNLTTDDYQLIALIAILVVVAIIAAVLTVRLARENRPPATGDTSSRGPNPLVRLLHSEPALVSGFVLAAASLLGAFGLDLTEEQTGAVIAVLSIVLAIAVRQSVYSGDTIAASGLAYDEADGTLKRRVR